MLEIKNLTKYYKDFLAIDRINITIERKKIYGFIGPNGAGKSTTIKCVMKLIKKSNGNVLINGVDLDDCGTEINEIIGYLPSEINLYNDFTVKEMLNYNASFYKKDCTEKTKYLVDLFEMDLSKKIGELSLGNLKKVGIVMTFMHDPKYVILDEATSGLDPLMQEKFYNLLLEEKQKGTTIFFSSHNLDEIKKVCDEVAIIKNGKIIKVDKVSNFMANFIIVTVQSKELQKIKKELDVKYLVENDKLIKFIYDKDIDILIKHLSKYDLDKLLLEEPFIEEVFMHYYKEDTYV